MSREQDIEKVQKSIESAGYDVERKYDTLVVREHANHITLAYILKILSDRSIRKYTTSYHYQDQRHIAQGIAIWIEIDIFT